MAENRPETYRSQPGCQSPKSAPNPPDVPQWREMNGNGREIENPASPSAGSPTSASSPSATPSTKRLEVNPDMNGLRARVNALRRKMALELAAVRLRRLADEFSIQWTVARANRQPPLESHPFILRVADAGFRLPSFMAVHKYLKGCRRQGAVPDGEKLLRSLLPCSRRLVPAVIP